VHHTPWPPRSGGEPLVPLPGSLCERIGLWARQARAVAPKAQNGSLGLPSASKGRHEMCQKHHQDTKQGEIA